MKVWYCSRPDGWHGEANNRLSNICEGKSNYRGGVYRTFLYVMVDICLLIHQIENYVNPGGLCIGVGLLEKGVFR